MIQKLEGFNQYLAIAGFKHVQITNIDKFLADIKEKTGDSCVQFFDASLIAGPDHLRFAALNSLNAFRNKLNISNSLAIETLLYASAQHQIKDAVTLLGIKPESRHIVILVLAPAQHQALTVSASIAQMLKKLKGKRDDSVIELSNEKTGKLKQLFKISEEEQRAKMERPGAEKEALLDLVIEHMALLATER